MYSLRYKVNKDEKHIVFASLQLTLILDSCTQCGPIFNIYHTSNIYVQLTKTNGKRHDKCESENETNIGYPRNYVLENVKEMTRLSQMN